MSFMSMGNLLGAGRQTTESNTDAKKGRRSGQAATSNSPRVIHNMLHPLSLTSTLQHHLKVPQQRTLSSWVAAAQGQESGAHESAAQRAAPNQERPTRSHLRFEVLSARVAAPSAPGRAVLLNAGRRSSSQAAKSQEA